MAAVVKKPASGFTGSSQQCVGDIGLASAEGVRGKITPRYDLASDASVAADYIVSATEVQTGTNAVEPFDNPLSSYGILSTIKSGLKSFFGVTGPETWTWSSDINKFNSQLTDRFGAAARNGAAYALQERYAELKDGL